MTKSSLTASLPLYQKKVYALAGSYGGSSLISLVLGIGLVESVAAHSKL